MAKTIEFYELRDEAGSDFEAGLGEKIAVIAPREDGRSSMWGDEKLLSVAEQMVSPDINDQDRAFDEMGDTLVNLHKPEGLVGATGVAAVIREGGQQRRYLREAGEEGWAQVAEVVGIEESRRDDSRPTWFEAYRDFADQITADLHDGRFGDPKTPLARAAKTMLSNVSRVSASGQWSETDRQSLAVSAYDVARRAAREAGGEDGDRYAAFAGEVMRETVKNRPVPGAIAGFLRTDAELDAGRGFYNQLAGRLRNEYRMPEATQHFTGDDRLRLKDLVEQHSFGIVKGSAIYAKIEAAMGPVDIRRKPQTKAIESGQAAPKRRQAAEMEL